MRDLARNRYTLEAHRKGHRMTTLDDNTELADAIADVLERL